MDVPELLTLEYLLFPNAMTERMLHHELHRGRGWVCVEEGKIVGYVLVRREEGLLDVTRLGVSEEVRRKGVGRALMACVLEEPGNVILTVKKDNIPAIILYRKLGFAIVAHLAAAQAWVMKLTRASTG